MRSVRWVMRALSSPIPVGAGRLGDGRSTDRLGGEALEHVALDDVARRGEADAALEPGLDLADVVLEPAERVDLVGGDHLAAAPDAHAPGADDAAVGDVRAGDDRSADLDDLAHLGAPLDDLDLLRLEQARECLLDVVDELVDDVVQANVDLLDLGHPPGGVRNG